MKLSHWPSWFLRDKHCWTSNTAYLWSLARELSACPTSYVWPLTHDLLLHYLRRVHILIAKDLANFSVGNHTWILRQVVGQWFHHWMVRWLFALQFGSATSMEMDDFGLDHNHSDHRRYQGREQSTPYSIERACMSDGDGVPEYKGGQSRVHDRLSRDRLPFHVLHGSKSCNTQHTLYCRFVAHGMNCLRLLEINIRPLLWHVCNKLVSWK